MAREYEDNDVPLVFSTDTAPAEEVSVEDEAHLPALLRVQSTLNKAVAEIDSVHVFDLTESEGLTIKEQIAGYQFAAALVEPALSEINEVVNEIKLLQKGGN